MKAKTITVQIKDKKFPASYWYAKMQNKFFEVIPHKPNGLATEMFECVGRGREYDLIGKEDCKVIPDEILFANWLTANYFTYERYIAPKTGEVVLWASYKTNKRFTTKKLYKKFIKKFKTYKND